MRDKTNGKYPRYAVWENVTGALSSNSGEDFKSVIENFCQIKDSKISVPRPAKWQNAGVVIGENTAVVSAAVHRSSGILVFKPYILKRGTARSHGSSLSEFLLKAAASHCLPHYTLGGSPLPSPLSAFHLCWCSDDGCFSGASDPSSQFALNVSNKLPSWTSF